MRLSFPKPPWLRSYVLLFFTIIGLLTLYYFLYAPMRQAQAESRSFRLLADFSDQIQSSMVALVGPLTNFTATIGARADVKQWIGQKGIRNLEVLDIRTNVSGSPFLTCELGTAAGLPALEFQYHDASGKQIVARSFLKQIIDPLAREGDFDDLLVINGHNGEVLYQRKASDSRVTRLNLAPEARERSARTNVVSAAGLNLILFSQPMPIPYFLNTRTNNGSGWIVCGLVQARQFYRRTLSVPYSWSIPIFLLVIVALLAWPLLNAYFLGENLRLRPRHLCEVYLAALGGSALILLGCLMWLAYSTLEHHLDRQLNSIARRMLANFSTEVSEGVTQLRELDRMFSAHPEWTNRTHILAGLDAESPSALTHYPYFKMVVWIAASNGMQIAKWTPDSRNTLLINVKEREYFRRIKNGQDWTTSSGRLFIEPIYSWNTGENLVELSMRGINTNHVVSLTTRFLSFFQSVLPADFGFCVLDSEGRALFHSDENRNLRENFVTECNNDATLEATLRGRSTSRFDTTYCGRNHSVFVTPIPDLPWSLVVFRDESKAQAIQVATLSIAILLYLCSLVGFLGSLGLLLFVQRDHGWMWPAHGRQVRYLVLAILNLLLSAGLLELAFATAMVSWALAVIAMLLPLSGLWIAWLVACRLHAPEADPCRPRTLRWARWRASAQQRVSPAVAYWLALSSLILLSSTVPTMLLFKVAFDDEIQLLVKRAQMHLLNDMAARKSALREQYRTVSVPPGFLENRIMNQGWDCYFADFFDTTFTRESRPKTPHRPEAFSSYLTLIAPLLGKVVKESTAYVGDGASDGAWRWEATQEHGTLTLYADESDRDKVVGRWGIAVRSYLPVRSGWWWPLSGLALILPCFLSWRLVADSLLPINGSKDSETFVFDPLNDECLTGCRLVLGTHDPGRLTLPEHCVELDWRTGAVSTPAAGPKCSPCLQQICLPNFQEEAHDPQASHKKLAVLEQFLSDPTRSILIFTTVHPLNFDLGPTPGAQNLNSTAESPAEVRERWSQALSAFKTLYTPKSARLAVDSGPDAYRQFWATCTPRQKLTLFDLARTGLVNPKRPELPLLIARGVMREAVSPCQLHESFARWVLAHFNPEEGLLESAGAKGDLWRAFRGPLLLGLLIGMFVIFATQKSLWEETVGLLPAFAAALTAVGSALNLLWKLHDKSAS